MVIQVALTKEEIALIRRDNDRDGETGAATVHDILEELEARDVELLAVHKDLGEAQQTIQNLEARLKALTELHSGKPQALIYDDSVLCTCGVASSRWDTKHRDECPRAALEND